MRDKELKLEDVQASHHTKRWWSGEEAGQRSSPASLAQPSSTFRHAAGCISLQLTAPPNQTNAWWEAELKVGWSSVEPSFFIFHLGGLVVSRTVFFYFCILLN